MDADGCGIDEAVADACARGYAEGDPSADLDGEDAAAKLSHPLHRSAFGLRVLPAQIDTRTSARILPEDFRKAALRGGTIRQLAHAAYDPEKSSLVAWVAPTFVRNETLFARTTGPENAAVITGTFAGQVTLTGTGAGGDATAVAAIGDLIAIARDRAAIVPAPVLKEPKHLDGLTDHKLAEAV